MAVSHAMSWVCPHQIYYNRDIDPVLGDYKIVHIYSDATLMNELPSEEQDCGTTTHNTYMNTG